jgi:uncharacterized protein YyaL (SSP411 family)
MRLMLAILLLFSYSYLHAADNALLARHHSPYLQAHADDDIHWQLLTTDAIKQARQNQQLILVSSGYTSCYWCYRMKEDTFKHKETADFINQHLLPIIIDRELEPELDQYLQHFMQQIQGFGGWPVTVIFSPEGLPIAGFNYTKPEALTTTLQRLLSDWKTDSTAIIEKAQARHDATLERQKREEIPLQGHQQNQLLSVFLQQVQMAADEQYGGFGKREKFPHIPQLQALLTLHKINPDHSIREFLQTTLTAMLGGGLRDHLGGGFFRYTSDQKWTYPHYEQMLPTQALMASLLLDMGQNFKQPIFTEAGKETLLNMLRQFQRNDQLFRAGLAATGVDGKSGSYYLWDKSQLDKRLKRDSSKVVHNLLGQEEPLILPFLLNQSPEIKIALLSKRNQRSINTDDKALTGWNGLALMALVKGSHLSPEIAKAAEQLQKQLVSLLEQQSLGKMVDQPETDVASLSDRVYLAYGLYHWASHNKDKALQAKIKAYLQQVKSDFFQNDGWVQAERPLLGKQKTIAMPDDELPSATALWLEMATSSGIDGVDHLWKTLPQKAHDNAFYHASLIAGLANYRNGKQTTSAPSKAVHTQPGDQQKP